MIGALILLTFYITEFALILLGEVTMYVLITLLSPPQGPSFARQPTDSRHQAQRLAAGDCGRKRLVPKRAQKLGARGWSAVQVVDLEPGSGRSEEKCSSNSNLLTEAIGR